MTLPASFGRWLKSKLNASKKWLLGGTILVIFVLQGIEFIEIPFIKKLDGFASDMRLRSTLPMGQDKRIVIADIDEASLQIYGQWPGNRHYLAPVSYTQRTLPTKFNVKTTLVAGSVTKKPAINHICATELTNKSYTKSLTIPY